jgi:hypothetical protein
MIAIVGAGAVAAARAEAQDGSGAVKGMAELSRDLSAVRKSRVFFLHQSVGVNILDGLKKLDAKVDGAKLRIVNGSDGSATGPAIFEIMGGRNTDPQSKIDAFAAALRENPQLKPDVAVMKLCYVDFSPRTDVAAVFASYRSTLDALKREFPNVRFVHVTVPLTTRPSPLKRYLSTVLAREGWTDLENVRRAEFNAMLREEFSKQSIYDLARIEATAPDGRVTKFEHAGNDYLALYDGYTNDGGHLNEAGQAAAAAAAVAVIARSLERVGGS